jgi:predicted phage tail protein
VRVIGTAHPLNAVSGARIDRYLDVGLTIEQMLQEALEDHPDIRTRRDFIVYIDGNPIYEENWRRVRAKPGTTVTFVPRLQGGNALRTVLGVVVAIGALLIAGPLGSAFAGSAFGLAIGISAGTATALIGGGILPVGPIALTALFPTMDAHRC